jgi:hypothetical protein
MAGSSLPRISKKIIKRKIKENDVCGSKESTKENKGK